MRKFLLLLPIIFLLSCVSQNHNTISENLSDQDAFVENSYQPSDTLKIVAYNGSNLAGQLTYFGNHDYVVVAVSNRFSAKNREEAEKFIQEVNKKYKASIAMLVDETVMAAKFEDTILGQKKYSVGFFAKKK